jgi:hypothetical protein
MSVENVDVLRRANQALNRGDHEAAFADYHRDIGADVLEASQGPAQAAGLRRPRGTRSSARRTARATCSRPSRSA